MTTSNTAGYSGKPLVDKLGYKLNETVYLANAPEGFIEYLQKEFVDPIESLPATWLHGFFSSYEQIATFLQFLEVENIQKGIWMSWPKKSSEVKTDLSGQTFRDLLLPLGWVDTKVCAINETWSGLLFYRRKH